MAERTFTIGEAAKRAGVSPDTLRHYERVGLLPRAPRTAGGYRYYTDVTVARVLFVRKAIRLGPSMKELSGFLHARSRRPPCRPCATPAAAAAKWIASCRADRPRIDGRTIAAWDVKLARTPDGSPAHLLADAARNHP